MPKVFINPGHCPGIDPGAVNKSTGITEADIMLEVGTMVAKYLRAAGCEVMVLQSNNLNGEAPGENVCATANYWPADIFVSFHCNAFNGEARGTEIFTSRGETEADKLATCIMQQIIDTFGDALAARTDWSDGDIDKEAGYIVLNNTNMPAVLCEMVFIDNDADLQFLLEHKDDFARAYARGITDYMSAKQSR